MKHNWNISHFLVFGYLCFIFAFTCASFFRSLVLHFFVHLCFIFFVTCASQKCSLVLHEAQLCFSCHLLVQINFSEIFEFSSESSWILNEFWPKSDLNSLVESGPSPTEPFNSGPPGPVLRPATAGDALRPATGDVLRPATAGFKTLESLFHWKSQKRNGSPDVFCGAVDYAGKRSRQHGCVRVGKVLRRGLDKSPFLHQQN